MLQRGRRPFVERITSHSLTRPVIEAPVAAC